MCSGWERVGEDGPGLLERCMNTPGGADANHWIPGHKHPKAKRIAFDWAGLGWGRRESPVEMGEARWVTSRENGGMVLYLTVKEAILIGRPSEGWGLGKREAAQEHFPSSS